MSAGRPTKYKPEYCQEVVAFMAKGGSLTAFAAEIDTHRSQMYEWCKRYPDFHDAVQQGKAKRQSFFENLGLAGMTGQVEGFREGMWKFLMASQFKDDYTETQNINVNGGASDNEALLIARLLRMNPDEQEQRLAELEMREVNQDAKMLYLETKERDLDDKM